MRGGAPRKKLGPKTAFYSRICVDFDWLSLGVPSPISCKMDPCALRTRGGSLPNFVMVLPGAQKGFGFRNLQQFMSRMRSPFKLRCSLEADADSTEPTSACSAEAVCALAHPCAAERRLTVTGVNDFPGLHTSFHCPF